MRPKSDVRFPHLAIVFLCLSALVAGCGGSSSRQYYGARPVVKPPPPEIRTEQTKAWLAKVRELGKPGHWLVIRGYKDGDNFVVMATNTPLSHAALLDIERDRVIESLADGVVRNTLEHFVDHAHRLLIIQPKWWTEERGKAAAVEADTLVGKKYDWTGAIGLSDEDRFFCSELAVHVYRAHQTEKDHLPKVLLPSHMYLWGNIVWDSGERD